MRLRDCDGDIWEEDSEGGWELILDGQDSFLPNRDALEIIWGPLSGVDE